ncbi:Agamous-like MADS-box protein AGL62 [Cardamine amara subsp. amara]|uniref:Agamous-like MADS-box protein AGL62 n=1 Tax=Cardamine amara subsp. amara TaxID=228776 RepID=A0ABD1C3D6_CARAN
MVKTNKGRRRIEMKKITNKANLQISFSKRRFGLFKKATELCTLSGAEILIIVFSPGGKVFSFGHPEVKDLIDRFTNGDHNSVFLHQHNNNQQLVEVRPDRNIQCLNKILTEVHAHHEYEINKTKSLESLRESKENGENWYEKDVKELDMNETNNLICALQGMKEKLISEISHNQNYLGESSGHIPSFGYNNSEGIVPRSSMNYMSGYNFNQS